MEFDITHLDKKQLIQTLFAHSAPLNLGKAEYNIRKARGENVIGLSDEECEMILLEFNEFDTGGLRILDYHKGKPMKLVFDKKRNGRILNVLFTAVYAYAVCHNCSLYTIKFSGAQRRFPDESNIVAPDNLW